jgi:hypothetical protein
VTEQITAPIPISSPRGQQAVSHIRRLGRADSGHHGGNLLTERGRIVSRNRYKARATMALDGVEAGTCNRDRGADAMLDALREMVTATGPEPPTGLSLFSQPARDPVAALLDAYDEAVDDYGQPAAHGAVELLARIAAAAVTGLAEQRAKDPETTLLRIVRQFGTIDDE